MFLLAIVSNLVVLYIAVPGWIWVRAVTVPKYSIRKAPLGSVFPQVGCDITRRPQMLSDSPNPAGLGNSGKLYAQWTGLNSNSIYIYRINPYA